jgi:hypothetical protein
MLLTTIEVKHDDAYGSQGHGFALFGAPRNQRLEWYTKRFGISVYHRILTSGWRIEASELENVPAHELHQRVD